MTGLEKITGRILADAQARVQEMVADARAQADRLLAENNKAIEALRAASAADAEAQAEGLRQRAESAAENRRRNILLMAKNQMIDSAFDAAEKKLLSLASEEYTLLWGKILADAIRQMEEERIEAAKLYGEALTYADSYAVTVNAKDGRKTAEGMIAQAQKCLPDSVIASRLCVGDKTADISGGCVLSFGAVSMNCSVESLLAERRRACEGEICQILFEKG